MGKYKKVLTIIAVFCIVSLFKKLFNIPEIIVPSSYTALLLPFVLDFSGPSTTVQQAPTTDAPSAGDSAADLYQARLEYDPKVAAMEQKLQETYYPKQAALQAQLYQQYAPLVASIQEGLRQAYSPTQSALTEAFAKQGLERLESPFGYSEKEQSAVDAIRDRQKQDLIEQIRTRANLGGGLYGGRAASREEQALTELEQAFAEQDINRRLTGANVALQYAIPSIQQLYPSTQFPGQPTTQYPIQSPVTPGADTLYSAMYQASQPESFAQQTPAGGGYGLAGNLGGAAIMGTALVI